MKNNNSLDLTDIFTDSDFSDDLVPARLLKPTDPIAPSQITQLLVCVANAKGDIIGDFVNDSLTLKNALSELAEFVNAYDPLAGLESIGAESFGDTVEYLTLNPNIVHIAYLPTEAETQSAIEDYINTELTDAVAAVKDWYCEYCEFKLEHLYQCFDALLVDYDDTLPELDKNILGLSAEDNSSKALPTSVEPPVTIEPPIIASKPTTVEPPIIAPSAEDNSSKALKSTALPTTVEPPVTIEPPVIASKPTSVASKPTSVASKPTSVESKYKSRGQLNGDVDRVLTVAEILGDDAIYSMFSGANTIAKTKQAFSKLKGHLALKPQTGNDLAIRHYITSAIAKGLPLETVAKLQSLNTTVKERGSGGKISKKRANKANYTNLLRGAVATLQYCVKLCNGHNIQPDGVSDLVNLIVPGYTLNAMSGIDFDLNTANTDQLDEFINELKAIRDTSANCRLDYLASWVIDKLTSVINLIAVSGNLPAIHTLEYASNLAGDKLESTLAGLSSEYESLPNNIAYCLVSMVYGD